MGSIGSRQVHLDFHTSELIAAVGAKFDRKQWQRALETGRINSINVFAKCHHGWSYYPTEVGHAHPHLACDLLGRQIEACHEIGVRAPIYYTVGWSAHDAETHHEWRVRNKDGSIAAARVDPKAAPTDARPNYSWILLCPSGSYRKLILDQTREICERYTADGLWYDITNGPACYCGGCRRAMSEEGIDLDDDAAVSAFNKRKWWSFMSQCSSLVKSIHPDASLFFNGSAGAHDTVHLYDFNTEQDLEDLPSAWGGYNRFPLRARFFIRTGKPIVAMSGKFHTQWGEFGGFKHPDALRYEAASMISYGAACNFGDQLHPSGIMDTSTYRAIGEAYRYVERIEDYGLGGKPCANLGLWWGADTATSTGDFAALDNHRGVNDMLLESQIDYEVVDSGDDLSRFAAIILAGAACLDGRAARELGAYVRAGGKLLILGEGALDAATRKRFVIDVGAKYLGPARRKEDYLVAGPKVSRGLVSSPFLNYIAALRVRLTTGSALAAVHETYFDRTYAHYCGHMNAPYLPAAASHPGAWRHGAIVSLAHPLGKIYLENGMRLHRDFFINALRLVYPKAAQTLAVDMPSGGRVSLVHQPDRRRYVAHLLYGPATPRGRYQVIEDLVPLYDVRVRLSVGEKISRVSLPLEKMTLQQRKSRGGVEVVVPKVQCHEMVVFRY